MKAKYHHSSHSKYLIKLHIVFAVKYRKKLLVDSLDEDMKQLLFEISQEKGFTVDTMQSDIDHIHILVDIPPTLSAFQIVHQLKQLSTFRIWKKYAMELKKTFLEGAYILVGWLFCLFDRRRFNRNDTKIY